MRPTVLLLAALGLAAGLAAQTQTLDLTPGSPFTAIRVGDVFEVEVVRGDTYGVVVETTDHYAARLTTSVEDSVLVLDMEDVKWRLKGENLLKATITLPYLAGVDIREAASVQSKEPWRSAAFSLQSSGASVVQLALDAERVDVAATGVSDITLAGATNELEVNAGGAAEIHALYLISRFVKLASSGAAEVSVYAEEALTGNASGTSDIKYTGPAPRVDVSSAGVSVVERTQPIGS